MVGRASYENPWILGDVDRQLYGEDNPGRSRREVLTIWSHYAYNKIVEEKANVATMNKPVIHLFNGETHGNKFKRYLSDAANYKKHDCHYPTLIAKAIELLDAHNSECLDRTYPLFGETENKSE
jgi:tRNA-dihydrouridine synthase